MRGNQQEPARAGRAGGSIPAHAGKPPPDDKVIDILKGLSPPMRGNPVSPGCTRSWIGSIPAHAGKPPARYSPETFSWVYPRPCGETALAAMAVVSAGGLSPPMRGNLVDRDSTLGRRGSIPAHAGKPHLRALRHPQFGVYPRPCGETVNATIFLPDARGLSPPMRGNQAGDPERYGNGSIPAHAGKPSRRRSSSACRPGLSPPMRGNL